MKTEQTPAPRRQDVTTEVIRSAEALDFDAWARRLVGYVLEHEGVKVTSTSTAA